jgi:hypothetical protein
MEMSIETFPTANMHCDRGNKGHITHVIISKWGVIQDLGHRSIYLTAVNQGEGL